MRILIVEDEQAPAQALQGLLRSADSANLIQRIDIAMTFGSAMKKLRRTDYDLVFCDLLLLPRGWRVDGGKVVVRNDAPRRFTTDDWNRYVLQRGGIEVVRCIRDPNQTLSTRADAPIVVVSFFDKMPGYKKTVRPLLQHPQTVLLPKFFKNPAYGDPSGDPVIKAAANSALQLLLSGELQGAALQADVLRQRLFENRQDELRHLLMVSPDQKKGDLTHKLQVLNYSFVLTVRVDLREDEHLSWALAEEKSDYSLQLLYEDWQYFRNEVLWNPNVDVQFSLSVAYGGEGASHEIALTSLSAPLAGAANTVRRRLRYRAILCFLAAHAEPPQGIFDRGWTISATNLLKGTMRGVLEMDAVRRRGRGQYILHRHGIQEIRVDGFVQMERGRGSVSSMLEELRKEIDKEISSYYRGIGRQPPVAATHVIFSPGMGYFFNGDLEIEIPKVDAKPAEGSAFAAVAGRRKWHLAMGRSQTFECADDDEVSQEDLLTRLEVVLGPFRRAETLEEIRSNAREGDLVVCCPVDGEGMNLWLQAVTEESENRNASQLAGATTILVPDGETSRSLDSEAIKQLEAAGVHVVYTANCPTRIPEIKVIDSVLCLGPRTKYNSLRLESDPSDFQRLSEHFLSDFVATYENLSSREALGDDFSGSASLRVDDDELQFIITASQTRKTALRRHDLSYVCGYSPLYSRVTWFGERPPSSGTPWHAWIYRNFDSVGAIVHTHYKPVTYSEDDRLTVLRTMSYSSYGTNQVGRDLVEALRTTECGTIGAVILHSHGEVVVGANLEECVKRLALLRSWAMEGETSE